MLNSSVRSWMRESIGGQTAVLRPTPVNYAFHVPAVKPPTISRTINGSGANVTIDPLRTTERLTNLGKPGLNWRKEKWGLQSYLYLD